MANNNSIHISILLKKTENTNILAEMCVGSQIDFQDWNVRFMLTKG
jgi:hypothetical protein